MDTKPEVPAFFEKLCVVAPDLRPLRDEHLQDYDGEYLGHLLIADVGRWALQSIDNDPAAVDRVLAEMERSFTPTDRYEDYISNMIAVSFLEHLAFEPAHSLEAKVRSRLPPRLARAMHRIETWRPS